MTLDRKIVRKGNREEIFVSYRGAKALNDLLPATKLALSVNRFIQSILGLVLSYSYLPYSSHKL